MIKKFWKKLTGGAPELPLEILDEFAEEITEQTEDIETFFKVYKKHPMRKKLEKRMKIMEGHHNQWKEVQRVMRAMILLSKAAKKSWKGGKKLKDQVKTKKQIYTALFGYGRSSKVQAAVRLMEDEAEEICEYAIHLERDYLYHITDPKKKEAFAKSLVDVYQIWKEFFTTIEEKKYRVVE